MEKKMKTFLKRLLITALLISIIIPHTNTQYAKAEEKTKDIICLSIKGSTLTYADAVWTYELGMEDENIVGRPKKYTIKLASKVSYNLLKPTDISKTHSVSKAKFIKSIKYYEPKLTKDGKIKYYWGMAARITLSGKKVKKIKQIYQA